MVQAQNEIVTSCILFFFSRFYTFCLLYCTLSCYCKGNTLARLIDPAPQIRNQITLYMKSLVASSSAVRRSQAIIQSPRWSYPEGNFLLLSEFLTELVTAIGIGREGLSRITLIITALMLTLSYSAQ